MMKDARENILHSFMPEKLDYISCRDPLFESLGEVGTGGEVGEI